MHFFILLTAITLGFSAKSEAQELYTWKGGSHDFDCKDGKLPGSDGKCHRISEHGFTLVNPDPCYPSTSYRDANGKCVSPEVILQKNTQNCTYLWSVNTGISPWDTLELDRSKSYEIIGELKERTFAAEKKISEKVSYYIRDKQSGRIHLVPDYSLSTKGRMGFCSPFYGSNSVELLYKNQLSTTITNNPPIENNDPQLGTVPAW